MSEEVKLSPQTSLVLEYLSSGREITGLIAMVTLGVVSLTSRISELRKAGYDVMSAWSKDHMGKDYKKYWMPKKES